MQKTSIYKALRVNFSFHHVETDFLTLLLMTRDHKIFYWKFPEISICISFRLRGGHSLEHQNKVASQLDFSLDQNNEIYKSESDHLKNLR